MTTPLICKIISFIHKLLARIFGHEYGCCSKLMKRCSNCEYVKIENSKIQINNRRN